MKIYARVRQSYWHVGEGTRERIVKQPISSLVEDVTDGDGYGVGELESLRSTLKNTRRFVGDLIEILTTNGQISESDLKRLFSDISGLEGFDNHA